MGCLGFLMACESTVTFWGCLSRCWQRSCIEFNSFVCDWLQHLNGVWLVCALLLEEYWIMLPFVELKIQSYNFTIGDNKDRLREEHELQISSLTTTITELSKNLRKVSGFSSNLCCKKWPKKSQMVRGLEVLWCFFVVVLCLVGLVRCFLWKTLVFTIILRMYISTD